MSHPTRYRAEGRETYIPHAGECETFHRVGNAPRVLEV